eukprot:4714027-Pyramimonas_sp.AAC.1
MKPQGRITPVPLLTTAPTHVNFSQDELTFAAGMYGNLMDPLGFRWESYASSGIPMGILRVLWDPDGNPTNPMEFL